GERARDRHHLHADELEPLLLEAAHDASDEAALHSVGLHDEQGRLHRHERALLGFGTRRSYERPARAPTVEERPRAGVAAMSRTFLPHGGATPAALCRTRAGAQFRRLSGGGPLVYSARFRTAVARARGPLDVGRIHAFESAGELPGPRLCRRRV